MLACVYLLSDWETVDTFGLNDRVIALARGAHDPAYVLGRHPALIVVLSRNAERFDALPPHERGLYVAARGQGYAVVKTVTCREGQYYLWLMAAPGSRVWGALAGWHYGTPGIDAGIHR